MNLQWHQPYPLKGLLEEALEKSGNDIDSAIKSLNELSLGYVNGISGSPGQSNTIVDKGPVTASEDVSLENSPRNGAEWVELFVTEMTSATSIDDARLRAMRVLESLEKSITERAAGDAAETLHKASFSSHPNTQLTHMSENLVFKEPIEVLLRENAILKRAVAIQHE
ncbi:hypothetical protein HanXRQr2_Chr15g0692291 [Helianthus annuus]|uniref:Uncharacterized protein n=2 Tax=Helianthus annuus TaxID=4232 RepID=A0A9K3DZS8_HELAN|nr:hypothetical protein HanXRQr2_Chr15g0692291 [Helianthus annuus]KAJ0653336.1 hypothetical protein HanOQP8_Chr15g0582331 [Helianthus annuus]